MTKLVADLLERKSLSQKMRRTGMTKPMGTVACEFLPKLLLPLTHDGRNGIGVDRPKRLEPGDKQSTVWARRRPNPLKISQNRLTDRLCQWIYTGPVTLGTPKPNNIRLPVYVLQT